jgi:hypothetical protein
LTVIVVPARAAPAYNGDPYLRWFVWPTMQFSRFGEGATGGTPRLVSQNSAVPAGVLQAGSRPGRRFRNAGAPRDYRRTRRRAPGRGRYARGSGVRLNRAP